ncbi:MAG TPA: hypothetical protein VFS85_09550, partial [Dongiaceae bacterium]|nr:hypothetical protein [Dongiaceae bacterium]
MLKVLGYSASINVRKVLWTCDEIGVPYTQEEWGGSRSTRGPEFLADLLRGWGPLSIPVLGAPRGSTLPWPFQTHRPRSQRQPDARRRAQMGRFQHLQRLDLGRAQPLGLGDAAGLSRAAGAAQAAPAQCSVR